MRYPAFVADIAREEHREHLRTGISTGYGTSAVLLVLVAVGTHFAVLPGGLWAYLLIGIKLATNTAAWWAWRTRILYIELSALNIVADVALMTGAIYFTGGLLSPLLPIYFIEIAVMALLTNAGLTLATVLGSFVMYATMVLLVQLDVLPQMPSPLGPAARLSAGFVAAQLVFVAAVMFAPGAYVALMVDRLRQSERRLEARARQLVDASRAKTEFTTNVTHELRTPLHGILGATEMMEAGIYGPVTPRQVETLRTIGDSGRSLLELIDSLLVIARAEALRVEVRTAPVDVAEVVASVVATARMLVHEKQLSVEMRLADPLPQIRTDRQKLVQILVNLLANAVKFTPDHGHVVIEASPRGDGVTIVVRDTGIGIPAAALTRIFEPYMQVDGSALREHGGAGIGLSVVRTLADLLAIEVEVESAEDHGSTFTLRVPAGVPAADANPPG